MHIRAHDSAEAGLRNKRKKICANRSEAYSGASISNKGEIDLE